MTFKELVNSISKREWQFAALMAVIMIMMTGLPYLFGYLMAPVGTVYDGLHALSPGDIPIYYSYINQVKAGDFFVKNLFTGEEQIIGTFNAWWAMVGTGARIFNLSNILAFQLSRLLLIPVLIVIAYLFISYFFQSEIKRKICLFFLLFSGGVGFYFAGIIDLINWTEKESYWWPIDLWLTEANTFNALYQTSHFIASIALMLLIFLLMLLAFDKNKFSYAVISGFLSLFYFNFHPYYVPVIFGVLGLYLFVLMLKANKFLWRRAGYLIAAFLISLPSIIYHFWLMQNSPVIGQRAVQNVTSISPVIFVIMGYGFLWLGLILGAGFLLKNRKPDNRFIFLLIWLGVNLALIYSPFPFHSRYTQGLHVVLVIFTVFGLFELYEYLKIKLSRKTFEFWVNNPFLLGVLFLLLFFPSIFYSVWRDIYYFRFQPGEVRQKFYLNEDAVKAMEWLAAKPKPSIILAADIPSKFIPGFSNQTVYLAHAHETLFFQSKMVYLVWFLMDNKNDEVKKRFLAKERIDYIFYSEYEKELGSFDPAEKDYLKLVFDSPGARIYAVAD